MMRNGEHEWLNTGQVTGWIDVELNKNGMTQMQEAAKLIKDSGLDIG